MTVDVILIADLRVLRVPVDERGDALVDFGGSGLLRLDLRNERLEHLRDRLPDRHPDH